MWDTRAIFSAVLPPYPSQTSQTHLNEPRLQQLKLVVLVGGGTERGARTRGFVGVCREQRVLGNMRPGLSHETSKEGVHKCVSPWGSGLDLDNRFKSVAWSLIRLILPCQKWQAFPNKK